MSSLSCQIGLISQGMNVCFAFHISILEITALPIVASSANSKSPPTGNPRAILETFIPRGLINFARYKDVASPSVSGFIARIT